MVLILLYLPQTLVERIVAMIVKVILIMITMWMAAILPCLPPILAERIVQFLKTAR